MTQQVYKLSPSDFAYLYEECKRCYWLKVKRSIVQPSKPMPGIFGAINTRLQTLLVGKDLKELSNELPAGIVESQEGFVESVVAPNTNVFIKGKYDLLVRQPDGSYMIIDFKLSQATEEKIAKYQTQLMAYKFAFENPKYGEPKQIAKMGLVVMYPDQATLEHGLAHLTFPPKWMEITADQSLFLNFMVEVNKLLEGPEPQSGENCAWCKYRLQFPEKQQPVTLDLPF